MKQSNPFIKKRRISEESSIQITSMADIFIIILVFLLKSYSTSTISVQPTTGLQLPVADAPEDQSQAVQVEISEKAVQIDNQPAIGLTNFRFAPKDVEANGSATALDSLLKAKKTKQLAIAAANTDVKANEQILVVADQKVPYHTLKTVLASAAVSGYTDFKLVVVKKD